MECEMIYQAFKKPSTQVPIIIAHNHSKRWCTVTDACSALSLIQPCLVTINRLVLLNLQFIAVLEPKICIASMATDTQIRLSLRHSRDQSQPPGVCLETLLCATWQGFGWPARKQHFYEGAVGLNMNDCPDRISFTSRCPHAHTSLSAGCLAANGELLYAWQGMPQSHETTSFIMFGITEVVWVVCLFILMWDVSLVKSYGWCKWHLF